MWNEDLRLSIHRQEGQNPQRWENVSPQPALKLCADQLSLLQTRHAPVCCCPLKNKEHTHFDLFGYQVIWCPTSRTPLTRSRTPDRANRSTDKINIDLHFIRQDVDSQESTPSSRLWLPLHRYANSCTFISLPSSWKSAVTPSSHGSSLVWMSQHTGERLTNSLVHGELLKGQRCEDNGAGCDLYLH